MKRIAATEAKNRFGAVIDQALAEPIMIEKSGRASVVVMSASEYERLMALEDAYWASRAAKAEAGGWASAADVKSLLKDASSA
jgi:antitoxin Phd